MKIEHVALYVNDIEAIKRFYITYFDAIPNELYHNVNRGFQSYFLSFGDGARLEIMSLSELEESSLNPARIGLIHLAFSVGSEAKVDELTRRLEADGYEVYSQPRRTGDGYYESCVRDPEGNLVEITA